MPPRPLDGVNLGVNRAKIIMGGNYLWPSTPGREQIINVCEESVKMW